MRTIHFGQKRVCATRDTHITVCVPVHILLQAALAPDSKASGPSVLSVTVGSIDEKFVLCHLTPGTCDQWSLDIGFAPEDGEVLFHLTGKQSIHLTGFTELEAEDDDESDMDDDDTMPPTAAVAGKRPPLREPGASGETPVPK